METNNTDKALKTVAKGAGIAFIGIFAGMGIGYLYRILVARLLGPSEYGLLSIGIAVLGVLTTISVFGLKEAVARYVSFYMGKKNLGKVRNTIITSYKLTLLSSLIFSALLFISSDWIALKVFSAPRLSLIFKILALGAPFHILSTTTGASFRGFQKIEYKIFTDDIFLKISILSIALLAIYLGFGLLGVIAGYTISYILAFLVGFYILNKKLFFVFNQKIKTQPVFSELLRFSWPLLFAAIFWTIIGQISILMLGYLSTPFYVGIYNVALPTALLLMAILLATEMIFMPVASELFAKKQFKELANIFKVVSKWMFTASLPLFLLMIFFSDRILEVLFGVQYVQGAMVLSILAIGYFIASVSGPTGAILLTFKKTKTIFANNLIVLLVGIILNWYLIPIYGMRGAAIATAFAYSLWKLLTLFQVYAYTKLQPFRLILLKPMLAATSSILIVHLLSKIIVSRSIFILLGIFILFMFLYLILLLVFRSFEKEDIMIIKTLEKRLGLELTFIRKIVKKFL